MGLDQYLYKVRKLTADEKKQIAGWPAYDLPLWVGCIPEAEIDELLIGDWNGLYDIVAIEEGSLDHDAMERDLGVPDGYVRIATCMSGDMCSMSWGPKDDPGGTAPRFEASVSLSAMDKYRSRKKAKYALFHLGEEFQYWRKFWDIQEDVIEKYVDVENCAYHILPDECLWEMMDYTERDDNDDWNAPDEFAPPMCRPNERICYHPWW